MKHDAHICEEQIVYGTVTDDAEAVWCDDKIEAENIRAVRDGVIVVQTVWFGAKM